MKTEEFSEYARFRNGVETIPSLKSSAISLVYKSKAKLKRNSC